MKSDFKYRTICEVGCGDYISCFLNKYELNCSTKFIGFEPNPLLYNDLVKNIKSVKNVIIYNCAIYNKNEPVKLILAGKSSFLYGIYSPLQAQLRNQAEKIYNKITIYAKTIDQFDDGTIDLLLLDAEGCDYFVLEYIKSRPKCIQISTIDESGYINPFHKEIDFWMSMNGYELTYNNTRLRKCRFSL